MWKFSGILKRFELIFSGKIEFLFLSIKLEIVKIKEFTKANKLIII
jgi:hypothetical protein